MADDSQREPGTTGGTEVTVVLPCRNAGSVLPTQLGALARQIVTVRWEVVVVDDGSTDETVAVAHSYADALPIRVVANAGPHGAAAARNLGARWARSERLLFLDADDAVNDRYVQAMAEALATHPLVTALVDFQALNGPALLAACPRPHPRLPQRMFNFLPHAGAGAIGIQRGLFEALLGFDATIPWLHDADLCWRANLDKGVELFVVHDAVEYVRLRGDLRSLYRQGVANGQDGIRLRRRYAAYGVPDTPWSRHLHQWWKTARAVPTIGSTAGRNLVAWRLGKQIGRLRGLLSPGA